ncbi:MAG: CopG family antitoxin [Devosia sp.]
MSERDPSRGKPFPILRSDEEAEHFVATADLSEYDFFDFKPAKFFLRKDARVNMRLPAWQLERTKEAAAKRGIPYQRFIREAIDLALEREATAVKPRSRR